MVPQARGALKRSLSMVDVFSLGINGVVGSGIFLLPAAVAQILGPAAVVATLCAGVLSFLIALCFAEAASHFEDTGGPYLYARETLGPLVGFEVGWMHWWSNMASWAALANAFCISLAELVPSFRHPAVHMAGILALIAVLVGINYRGAKHGARVSNGFSLAKLLPLFLFVGVGLFFVAGDHFAPFAPHGYGGLGNAVLVMFYAFVGFESLVVPAGEMKNPQRSVPLALLSSLTLVTLLYLGVLIVATGTLTDVAAFDLPVAASAETFLGTRGRLLIVVGIVLSITGVNASMALVVPRNLYALAHSGHMPRLLAVIHPVYGTPVRALLLTAAITAALALSGSFQDLAVIAVMARFVQYLSTCLAVFVLRHRDSQRSEKRRGFRLPCARGVAGLAIALSLVLLSQAELKQVVAGAAAAALGVPVYLYMRRRPPPAAQSGSGTTQTAA